jgi:hypothetical protein
MTELVHYQQPATGVTGTSLVQWGEALTAAHRIGSALCSTAFAPQHFRGKPDEAAAAILYGAELGFSPTQALRSIFIIGGSPGLYAKQMVALVLTHGHEVWTEEKTDAKVTVSGKRAGSTHVISETWTTARAAKAGYTKNPKYGTDPQAMLYARAAADVCRQVAPDALAGLAVTVEELEYEQPLPTVRVSRAKAEPTPIPEPELDAIEAPQPTPEPDLEPPVDAEEVHDEPGAGGITDAQMRMLHASFNEAGITDRDVRLTYCRNLIGRDVESSKDLTKAEASRVIDALVQDASEK